MLQEGLTNPVVIYCEDEAYALSLISVKFSDFAAMKRIQNFFESGNVNVM